MKKICLALAFATVLSTTGCFSHVYYNAGTTPAPAPAVYNWNHYLFWGLVGLTGDYALNRICPQGVARVENWVGPLQTLLTWLTIGIYAPTTVRITCVAGNAVNVPVHVDKRVAERLRARFGDLVPQLRRALAHPDEPPATPAVPLSPAPLASATPARASL